MSIARFVLIFGFPFGVAVNLACRSPSLFAALLLTLFAAW